MSPGFGTAFEVTAKYTSNNLNGVGANGNVFVAVGDNGTYWRSNNGDTWTGVTTTTITTKFNHAHYGGGSNGSLLVLQDLLLDLLTMD